MVFSKLHKALHSFCSVHYTVKKACGFPVPSQDITNQTFPSREKFNYSPGRVASRLGTGKSIIFFTVYFAGYIMFYVRTPRETGDEMIGSALSLLWMVVHSVQAPGPVHGS
jgi:hypothetical protein